jgi:hypothetical protein
LDIFLPWRHNASENRPILVIILLWLCVITTKSAEEGIWVEAKINGQPVRFAFDTGTGPFPTLYSTTAKRLGLEIAAGKTELCKLEIGEENFRTPFSVFEIPPYLTPSGDGQLGWPVLSNNISVAFVPRDLQSDDLVAHVVAGSPAYEAGIRDGDILLKVGRDVANWCDPNSKINAPFREQPAGTKFELTLKRGDKVFKTTAVLRNILPPDAPKNLN